MNGTEWTEPGQGATIVQIARALSHVTPTNGVPGDFATAWGVLNSRRDHTRTNLRLTGQPLTAADVQRIAEAK